jgi:hypothetical protein
MNSVNSLSSFTKDLKKCFISLKSQNNLSKISKKNSQNTSRRLSKNKLNTTQNSKNSKNKSQPKSLSSTPLEFFMEFKNFSEKEKKNIIEKEKEKKIIEEKEEKKKIMKIKKQIKKQKKIDLKNEKFDNFWKKVQYYINKKNEHLGQISSKIKLRNEESEKNFLRKFKPNKTSILLYPKSRTPLYKYKNINENLLNRELHHFYHFCQKERGNERGNDQLKSSKTQNSIKYYVYNEDEKNFDNDEKYKKFYDDKLSWLKKRDDKINIKKKYLDKEDDDLYESLTFKPHIEQKSIKLVKKRNSFISFIERNGISMEDVEEAIKVPEDQATTMHVWTYGISALKELHENMQVIWTFSQRVPKKHGTHLLAQASHAQITRNMLFKDLADYAEACVDVENDQSEPTVRLMYSWANAVIDSAEDAFKFAQHLENELTAVATELDEK